MKGHQTAFVRKKMLPEKPAPASSMGALGWLRENLFSNVWNGALTLLGLYFVYAVLSWALPWIFVPTWSGESQNNCREMLSALGYGHHREYACWGVIRDRWLQLLFGFYPPEHYWRVIVAFASLILALAPVLFTNLPRRLLYFSGVYPFLCYWLLWGGSIWGPVMVLLGLLTGWIAFIFILRSFGALLANIALIFVPILFWIFLVAPLSSAFNDLVPVAIAHVGSDQFGGFMLSMTAGVSGIALSLPLGILLALGRQSDMLIIKAICVGFIEFIRGVPLITLLFVASTLLNYFLPPGTNFDIVLRVIIMVTLFASAYMAEVIRGGLAALPKGQYEGADSLGLDYAQTTRLIILPQALKISIPSIVSTFIGLFKDTTLVSVIGLLDPIGLKVPINSNQEWNGLNWEIFGVIGLVFFVFCFSMSRYSMYLERKLETDHR